MATRERHHRSLAGFIGAKGGVPSVPANTVVPVITGVKTVGQVLTGSTGTWTGIEAPVLTRQWKRTGIVIPGATAGTYTLVTADQGKVMTVTVTGKNWAGTVSVTSAGTAPIAP